MLTQLFASANLTAMVLLETSPSPNAVEMMGKQISYMSDNILLLGLRPDGEGGRTISIAKSRGTLGGYVAAEIGELTQTGQSILRGGVRMTVIEIRDGRVRRLRGEPLPEAHPSQELVEDR